jgi:hypothetical protein
VAPPCYEVEKGGGKKGGGKVQSVVFILATAFVYTNGWRCMFAKQVEALYNLSFPYDSRSPLRPFNLCVIVYRLFSPNGNWWRHHFIMLKSVARRCNYSVYFGHHILIYWLLALYVFGWPHMQAQEKVLCDFPIYYDLYRNKQFPVTTKRTSATDRTQRIFRKRNLLSNRKLSR